jgi:hypothetical protein
MSVPNYRCGIGVSEQAVSSAALCLANNSCAGRLPSDFMKTRCRSQDRKRGEGCSERCRGRKGMRALMNYLFWPWASRS